MKEELIRAIRRDLDPKFQVTLKDQFWLTRWLEKLGHNAAIILGHILYVPRTDLLKYMVNPYLEDAYWSQLYAHEGMHLAQRKDLGWFKFHLGYTCPEVPALLGWLVGLVTLIVFKCLGIIGIYSLVCVAVGVSIAFIVLGVNRKFTNTRAMFETEAYATTAILDSDPKDLKGISQEVWDLLNSPIYLWCGRSMNKLDFTEEFLGFALKNAPITSARDAWRAEIRRAHQNSLDPLRCKV